MFVHRFVGAAALALLGSLTGTARADAVMPPPTDCPPGTTPTSDHGGPKCEKDAPSDCPPGWRGVLGGRCELWVCASNDQCGEERECVAHDVCHAREERWFRFGGRTGGALGGASRALLGAAPPIPLDEPDIVWEPIDVCGVAPCEGDHRECRKLGLCVPRGASAAPRRVASPGSRAAGGADGDGLAGDGEAGAHRSKAGCASCEVEAGADIDAPAAAVAFAAGLAIYLRRRRP